jgi:hypothetical protein
MSTVLVIRARLRANIIPAAADISHLRNAHRGPDPDEIMPERSFL